MSQGLDTQHPRRDEVLLYRRAFSLLLEQPTTNYKTTRRTQRIIKTLLCIIAAAAAAVYRWLLSQSVSPKGGCHASSLVVRLFLPLYYLGQPHYYFY